LNIYPNPARDFLNINLSKGSELRVENLLGKELLHYKNTRTSERIDVASFESGIYFIQVSKDGKTATMRFLKN